MLHCYACDSPCKQMGLLSEKPVKSKAKPKPKTYKASHAATVTANATIMVSEPHVAHLTPYYNI